MSKVYDEDYKINIQTVLSELEWLPMYDSQISLQTVEGHKGDPDYGTGKLNKLNHIESDFTVPLFPKFKYINKIMKELELCRTRVMKMVPHQCYSYHVDPTRRVHIPLITDDKCMMIIDDEVIRLPANGKHYITDTRKLHTAMNCSNIERIHIVGCMLEDYDEELTQIARQHISTAA